MLIRIQILHFQVTKSYIEYRENMDEKQKIGLKKAEKYVWAQNPWYIQVQVKLKLKIFRRNMRLAFPDVHATTRVRRGRIKS